MKKECIHRKDKKIPKWTDAHVMGYDAIPNCSLCGKKMSTVFLPGNNFECKCCKIDEFGQDTL
jgi:hypothetical protein